MDLPWHLKTLACSVVHPKLDENEQPPLVNDYVDLPVANILHPSGHVVPTPLLDSNYSKNPPSHTLAGAWWLNG